jgi:predicted phage terminase large subunit-like protein
VFSKLFPQLSISTWEADCRKTAAAALKPMQPVRGALEDVPDLAPFIDQGWHVLEPTTPLEWNWHIDAVAAHLQAAIEDWMAIQLWRQEREKRHKRALALSLTNTGTNALVAPVAAPEDLGPEPGQRIQNLLINIPPGTAKSRIVSVFFPAWVWLKWPSFRWLCLSANPRVALRDSVYCRDLIESKWYRETFKPDWNLSPDQNAKSNFKNTAGGFRSAFGYGSRITGDRADAIVWDDPHDADEVHSDKLREGVLERWDGAIGNRVNDLRCSLRIGVMQRLHEGDLSGHVLKQGWEHVCLPMEFEKVSQCRCPSCVRGHTAIGWKDPRTKDGELLFPQRFPPDVLDKERKRMGSAKYAGQMQQQPAPSEGEIFKKPWWRFWVPKGHALTPYKVRLADGSYQDAVVEELDLDDLEEMIQSWDMAFKDTKTADFVVGGVWGRAGTRKYLLDQVRDRMGFTRTVKALQALSEKWPDARIKLIEDKANGPAVMDALKGKVSGMVAVEPEGSKIARAHAVSPEVEGGDVYLPHPDLPGNEWVELYLAEFTQFPFASKDDQVDQTTQALKRWIKPKKKKSYEPAVF